MLTGLASSLVPFAEFVKSHGGKVAILGMVAMMSLPILSVVDQVPEVKAWRNGPAGAKFLKISQYVDLAAFIGTIAFSAWLMISLFALSRQLPH